MTFESTRLTSAIDEDQMETEDVKHFLPQTITQGTQNSSPENCIDVNETAKTIRSKESAEPTTELQSVMAKFTKEYFQKRPDANLVELTSAMNKELELPLKGTTLVNCVAQMIYKCRDVLRDIELGNCNMEDDKEFIYEQCPYFDEMHEALQFRELYRKSGNRRGKNRKNYFQVESSKRKKFELKLESDDEDEMETAEKPEDDVESESGTVSRSYKTDDNLENTETAMESECESPMDEGNCEHTGNDELEPNTAEEKESDYEPSDDESSGGSSTPSEDEADYFCKKKSEKRGKSISKSMMCYTSIAVFMKEYFKKNPSSSRMQMIRAYRNDTKTHLTENSLIQYSSSMIRSYRQLRCEFDRLSSCANREKLISERCPYYDDIHEAYQYSDYYRNSSWTPTSRLGRPPQKTSELQPTTSNALCNDEMETTEEVDCEPSNDEKAGSSSTSSKDEADWKNSKKGGITTSTMKTFISMARFMKEYFKENPSSLKIQMVRAYRKETKTLLAENTIERNTTHMISSYRQLRWEFEKLKSCANRKKLISERCPYYDDIHKAYQYSDFYRNSSWKPTSKGDQPPQKKSELQPTTSNASRDDEMETTDETSDCPTSPKTARRSISEGKNSTSRDRHLERSVIGREAVIRIPPLKMQGCDQKRDISEDTVVETPPVEIQECDQSQADGEEAVVLRARLQLQESDHRQESSTEPVEQAKATVKNEVAIGELKLSSDRQLELIKLEDRKEERQFQMQLTKLRHDNEITKLKLQQENENMKLKLQQEHEIMKLKLRIEYERVKNFKQ